MWQTAAVKVKAPSAMARLARFRAPVRPVKAGRGKRERLRSAGSALSQNLPPNEGKDVGADVNREQRDPEEGRGGDVGRDVCGDLEHERRRQQIERHPMQAFRMADWRQRCGEGGRRGGRESDRPEPRLSGEAQRRFTPHGIAQPGEQASGVACDIQEVRVPRSRMVVRLNQCCISGAVAAMAT